VRLVRLPRDIEAGVTMNFDIKTEQLSENTYVISLAGEVDLYTAPEFKQQLLEVIGQGGTEVVVDFTDTTFIDSTTLGVLVGGVKRLRSNDGQLSHVCSDRNITKIFEITGLDRVFTIYPTRDEAISQLGNTGSAPPA
jgi:anti-sigma B factor antagonist